MHVVPNMVARRARLRAEAVQAAKARRAEAIKAKVVEHAADVLEARRVAEASIRKEKATAAREKRDRENRFSHE